MDQLRNQKLAKLPLKIKPRTEKRQRSEGWKQEGDGKTGVLPAARLKFGEKRGKGGLS